MINFLRDLWTLLNDYNRDLWTLLNDYKLRAYDYDGVERFAIPLSWIFTIFLLCLLSA